MAVGTTLISIYRTKERKKERMMMLMPVAAFCSSTCINVNLMNIRKARVRNSPKEVGNFCRPWLFASEIFRNHSFLACYILELRGQFKAMCTSTLCIRIFEINLFLPSFLPLLCYYYPALYFVLNAYEI